MLEKLKNIFICNGFKPEEIIPIRYKLVDTTIDGMKKLAMGAGTLYIFALFPEKSWGYFRIDIIYILVMTIFMLLVNVFQRKKNYLIAEFAIVYFTIAVLSASIYESAVLSATSRGAFFPIFLILIAVTFTGNPLVIDILMFLMTVIYLAVSYHVKSDVYFHQDLFTGVFTLLICNMVNAMIARSRISMILHANAEEESRKRYETLYDTIPCGIMEYTVEPEGQRPININQQGLSLLGYTKEEMESTDMLNLLEQTHPEDWKKIADVFDGLKEAGDKESYEYRIKRKDNTYVWVVGRAQVIEKTEKGLDVLSVCIDIDAAKKAIDANEAKSKFLSRMSHDIRTPMNAIIGLTDIVLEDETLGTATRENMKSVKSSSKFLLGLINDILDVSKIEADEMELHPEPYHKEEFVDYLNTMIRPLCEKKGVNFVVDTQKTKYAYIMLDKVRFNQVFFNLLSNAVKFTPAGGTISVNVEHIRQEGNYLTEHIRISDTGIGMSREFQRHMFDPFSQENTEHVNANQGSGLGLSIVKRVVDLMQGTLEVTSAPGEGTTFDIYLDVEICEGTPEERVVYDTEKLSGKRVLVCEDHPINRQIAESLLKKAGIITEFAVDGVEGVQKFQQSAAGSYQAVLMDIRMPNMGGLEAARKMRESKHPEAKTIPIIAMTANVFDTDRQASKDVGMNDHIAKPIDRKLLYQTLAKYM